MTQPKQEMRKFTDEKRRRLAQFFDILIEIDQKEKARQKRLINEPKGFSMPGEGRNCSLCKRELYSEDGWYDKWGFKSINCQDAINKRRIPGSLCRDYKNEKCMTDSELASRTNSHVQTIRKLIRRGEIKGRRIPNGPYLILEKDNKDYWLTK
ncbi:MAG: helix-turn-helix domain-containing protein [Candidatus Nomurabacteria bacterium]|jgi:hypothetical protein|nr:helix-turn-helix domain-containing protein [Candidatus Nomurabacteria bacterium]